MAKKKQKTRSNPKKEPEQEKRSFLEQINKFSNLIVGTATVLLVIVTSIYIKLSSDIAKETKRLADISVEQFKIKSYPTFLILRTTPSYINGIYKDEITIQNKGEISSHQTSFLIFYAIRTREANQAMQLSFAADWIYIYLDKDTTKKLDVLDYTVNIPSDSGKKLGINTKMPPQIFDNLKDQIIIIRHKVPYDDSFSYEIQAFGWENKKKDSDPNSTIYNWETLPDSQRDMLINKLMDSDVIAPGKEDKIKEFLKDYPLAKHIRFHKKGG